MRFRGRTACPRPAAATYPARSASTLAKGAGQRRLHVHGDAYHGSTPYGKDFAILKIGEVARRIAAAEPPIASNEIWEGFVKTFKFDPETEAALIAGTGDYSKFGDLAAYAHAFSHTTIAETVLRAGGAINVLPSHAYLEMDIRPSQARPRMSSIASCARH